MSDKVTQQDMEAWYPKAKLWLEQHAPETWQALNFEYDMGFISMREFEARAIHHWTVLRYGIVNIITGR